MRTKASFTLLILLLIAALAAALLIGPADVGVMETLRVLLGLPAGDDGASGARVINSSIIREIRLPRALLALLVGAGLATTGAAIQGLFRNPLADPALIGVSSGAALAAAAYIVLGGMLFGEMALWSMGLPLCAFLGGLVTTWLVIRIGASFGGSSIART